MASRRNHVPDFKAKIALAALSGSKTVAELSFSRSPGETVGSARRRAMFKQNLGKGFLYLVAIMDCYSRKAPSWRLSAAMDVDFCSDAREEALTKYGAPEIFNTNQGNQFTSTAFTSALQSRGIRLSHGWPWPVAG